MEPFDADHQPACIKTPNCQHTFGRECLNQWIESGEENSNKCPLCREELFFKLEEPEFIEGARDEGINSTMLHQIETWVEAKKFIKLMWRSLYKLYERDQTIYDSDIEEQINAALARTAENYNHTHGLYIFSNHWPEVRLVARDMVEHFHNGFYLPMEIMQRRCYFYSLSDALGWDVQEPRGALEDEMSDDDTSMTSD